MRGALSSDDELLYSNHDAYDDFDDMSSVDGNEIPKDAFDESYLSDCEKGEGLECDNSDVSSDTDSFNNGQSVISGGSGFLKKKRHGITTSGSKMVYVVLSIAALAFSIATYYLLEIANQQEFHSEVRPSWSFDRDLESGLSQSLILSSDSLIFLYFFRPPELAY